MRAKRIVLIAAASIAGAAGLAVAAAFLPPVQTWAAQRRLASIAGPGASLESASARWNHLSITGLRLNVNGAVLFVPSAEADMGVLSAYFGRNISATRLVAKGWLIDLSQPDLGGPQGPGDAPWFAKAVSVAFSAFNVPAKLTLDGVDLEGTVILSDEAGRPMGKARVAVQGGGLAPGGEGRFQYDTYSSVDDAAAPVAWVSLKGTLTASLDALGKFTRADFRMDAAASGRKLPGGIALAGAASAERSAGNISYSLSLSRGTDRVAFIDARSSGDPRRVSGSWKLDIRDSDLAPFTLGRQMPDFTMSGEGAYEADASTGDGRLQGKLKASADRLGVVARDLAPLGRIDVVADFDMARTGSSLRVDRLETRVSAPDPVASVLALQPFEFNPGTGELKVARPTGDLVGITVSGIPLSWLMGRPGGYSAAGSALRGEFAMRAEDGRLALRTKAPLTAEDVAVSGPRGPIASGLGLSAFVLADYAVQGWQVQLAPFAVRAEGVKMLSLEARIGGLSGSNQEIKAAGSWSSSLPALSLQPFFASKLPTLAGGEASGSFEASLAATRQLEVKVALRDLEITPGAPALPTVAADLRVDFGAGGPARFDLPIHLGYGGRAADLSLKGTMASDSGGSVVNAELSAARISIEDLAALGALAGLHAPAAPMAAPGGPAAAANRAAAPFWPRGRGRISVRVDDIAFPTFDLGDVRGAVAAGQGFLELEGGSATFGDGTHGRVAGKLSFTPGAVPAYGYTATVSVTNLDSAPFFHAANPDVPPAVEGRFDLTGTFTGSGDDFHDLADRTQGECRLSSQGGIFRALRTGSIEPLRQASKLTDAVDTVTALFGKKGDKIVDAVISTAEGLSEIHYDQLSIRAARGADQDIHFTEISLLAPEERIGGTGTVTHVEGVPIGAQPFAADLDMGVRGKLGGLLGLVDMLKEDPDDLGYRPLYQSVHLGGTLGNIDQSQWRDMLVRAPLRKAGGLFDKLLGR